MLIFQCQVQICLISGLPTKEEEKIKKIDIEEFQNEDENEEIDNIERKHI